MDATDSFCYSSLSSNSIFHTPQKFPEELFLNFITAKTKLLIIQSHFLIQIRLWTKDLRKAAPDPEDC